MKTLSGVIGATRNETARLLIELDARASETGNDVWAYIKDKPIPGGGEAPIDETQGGEHEVVQGSK